MARFRFPDETKAKSLVNQYKRCDVFRCQQEGHTAFDYRVSVYHVLKEKRCYPHGCLSFSWKCVRFNKGLSCPRGFRRAGRMCFGCRYFVDEKINHRSKVVLSPERFEAFKSELREFENWVEELQGREVNYSGTVFSVKPHLSVDPSRNRGVSFHGFLVILKDGFVNLVQFRDFCYLRESGRVQEKHRFRPGDRLDFFARFSQNRGRIILEGVNRVEVEHREEGSWWTERKARLALQTGTLLEGQPEKCLNCEKGCLVDAKQGDGRGTRIHRRLFCLEGVRDPWLCVRVGAREEKGDECGIRRNRPAEKNRLTTRSHIAIGEPIFRR